MDFPENILNNSIRFVKNKETPNVFDVELDHIDELSRFSSIQCNLVLYPYSFKINAAHFDFIPFIDYMNDLHSRRESIYEPIKSRFNIFFGLLLGVIAFLAFYLILPSQIYSIKFFAFVLGAFFLGKETWEYIDKYLVKVSATWPINFRERCFFYQLRSGSSLRSYINYAGRRKYGKSSLLPERLNFVQKQNSQTVRSYFSKKKLQSFDGTTAHLFSIQFNRQVLKDFEEDGFMFGVKLSLNETVLGITRSREYYQSYDKHLKGCLDQNDKWMEKAVFARKAFSMGRIKILQKKEYLKLKSLLDVQLFRGRVKRSNREANEK